MTASDPAEPKVLGNQGQLGPLDAFEFVVDYSGVPKPPLLKGTSKFCPEIADASQ